MITKLQFHSIGIANTERQQQSNQRGSSIINELYKPTKLKFGIPLIESKGILIRPTKRPASSAGKRTGGGTGSLEGEGKVMQLVPQCNNVCVCVCFSVSMVYIIHVHVCKIVTLLLLIG